MNKWSASCSQSSLLARAKLYALIRAFFSDRNVLEVETPVLSAFTATDPQLESIPVRARRNVGGAEEPFYLQTSPEFAMKRLLASGSGAIYQICKTFRNGESGYRHNPEFSMLEWYRPDFSLADLMQEVAALVTRILGTNSVEQLSYRDAFLHYVSFDPFTISDQDLELKVGELTSYVGEDMSRDDKLNLVLSLCIEPKLGMDQPCFLVEYPPSQASLAQVGMSCSGHMVAQRFELYIQGVELANGYFELTDASEQYERFEQDNRERQALALPVIPPDVNLLAALENGLPACSGVALGLDRLLMLQTGAESIGEVLCFPIDRA